MATELINVLRRKLAAYEGAGMDGQAKAVKSKLAVAEKAAAKADKAETKAEPPEAEKTSNKEKN